MITLSNKPVIKLRPGTKQWHSKIKWKDDTKPGNINEADFYGDSKEDVASKISKFLGQDQSDLFTKTN